MLSFYLWGPFSIVILSLLLLFLLFIVSPLPFTPCPTLPIAVGSCMCWTVIVVVVARPFPQFLELASQLGVGGRFFLGLGSGTVPVPTDRR